MAVRGVVLNSTPGAQAAFPAPPVIPCRGNDRYPYTVMHRGAARRPAVIFGGKWQEFFGAIWRAGG
jgi:hypothetical protein